MSSVDSSKSELEKSGVGEMFMDLCNEEAITHGIKGGSLNVKF